jgi:hypothetical protein
LRDGVGVVGVIDAALIVWAQVEDLVVLLAQDGGQVFLLLEAGMVGC